jgi:hypothetical protein
VVVLATFILIQGYEQRLSEAAEALRQKNAALSALEAERDTRLVELASDLAVALADIVSRSEVALSFPGAVDAMEEFTAMERHAHEMQSVIDAMVQLRRNGARLDHHLPPAEYQPCRCGRGTQGELLPV